ncbi:unnamed protein product [Cylindrotheca closterium]|uniref:Uncharacterized protein n=1 Tax=Cylindrotheca closterium TaxID=2856 RepID=A0AAD2PXS9_9STRA|nr:unnamed protein product [Cylindrotheca closterium]
MMSILSSSIPTLLTLLLLSSSWLVGSAQAREMCNLCGSHYVTPDWDNTASTAPFMTCRQVYFQLATLESHDHRCSPLQQQFNYACCTGSSNTGGGGGGGGGAALRAPPVNTGGNEPTCNICNDGSYPGNPNKFISARYVGSYSCGTLFERGRDGHIPSFMCGPLKLNLQQSCGCGQFAPPPTPSPVRKPTRPPTRPPTGRPTRPPTPHPTRRPSPRPTPSPTRPPTPSPTPKPTRQKPTKPPTRPPTDKPTSAPTEFSAIARKEMPEGGSKVALKYAGGYSQRNYGQRRGLKETLSQEAPKEMSD